MFNDLLQLFFAFGINLPPEFSTFFRALVTLEGTLTTLSPGYQVIAAAEEIAAEWARASLAPDTLEELARRELGSLALLLRRAPRQLDRIATIVHRPDPSRDRGHPPGWAQLARSRRADGLTADALT